MNSVIEKAYAKINLYLDIASKREDGYHNILSVMQNITLCDTVNISLNDSDKISLTCNVQGLERDSFNNFAYRAAEEFLKESGYSFGVNIDIQKNIPIAAGMAGGSSDAAAVLRGLNRIFENHFDTKEICLIGKRIGADVPFCILGGAKTAKGIGDILEPSKGIFDCYIVVACGRGDFISTPEAYEALDKKFDNFEGYNSEKKFFKLLQGLETSKLELVKDNMYNVFESVIESKTQSVTALKKIMIANGADVAMMSGSGPAVFGIFRDVKKAQATVKEFEAENIFAQVCEPLNELPEIAD